MISSTATAAPGQRDGQLYVWMHLPGALEPVLCGRVRRTLTAAGLFVGEFVYGKSWLDNPAALPIDAVLLPLSDNKVVTSQLSGHFSALLDAGPDRWGRRLIDRDHGTRTELGYLLRSSGDQVGALAFTASPDTPPQRFDGFDTHRLSDLCEAAEDLERGIDIAPHLDALLRQGTSAGGARPKATVIHDGALWLAKFSSAGDAPDWPDNPRLEAATLDLAALCGLNVPEHQLVDIGTRAVLLVKRFDREALGAGRWTRRRYVSARTVFHSNPDVQRYAFTGSYPRLSIEFTRWSANAELDRIELFKRMAFNCLVSNTDDHELNHGLVDRGDGRFVLSPLFDVVPQPSSTRRQYLKLLIGAQGALATRANLASECRTFGLHEADAGALIDSMTATIRANVDQCLAQRGISAAHRAKVAPLFCPVGFTDEGGGP